MISTYDIPIVVKVPQGESILLGFFDDETGQVTEESVDITEIAAVLIAKSFLYGLVEPEDGVDMGRIVVPDGTVVTVNREPMPIEEALEHISMGAVKMIVEAAEMTIEKVRNEAEDR